jgi:membrane-associated protein
MDIFKGEHLVELIKAIGMLGIFGLIFCETGLLIGVFLPGDSVLFTAGVLAAYGNLNIYVLIPTIFVAAVIGDNIGYLWGNKLGHRIFNREDSVIFHKDNVLKAQEFYDKYGTMALIISRYIPIVRTFAPLVAGVGKMPYKRFFFVDLLSCFIWSFGLTLAGFYLIKAFPGLEKNITLVIFGIIVASLIFPGYHYLRSKFSKK